MPQGKPSPRHLLQMSPMEQKKFLNSFDYVFSDCDGVVWSLAHPLPKTGEAINVLKEAGKKVKFVTNNSFTTHECFMEKFLGIGLKDFQMEDVIHPIKVIIDYLKLHRPKQKVYSLASLEANLTLEDNGIQVETLDIKEHLTPTNLMPYLKLDPEVGAVIFDINLDLTYAQVTKAIDYLAHPDCLLLCGGSDRFLPFTSYYLAPGFVNYLDHIQKYSGKEPLSFGKPDQNLGRIILEKYQIKEPKRCLFVGDTLASDIKFGNQCGFQTLLVLTGTTTEDKMLEATDDLKPDYYTNGLKDFIEIVENSKRT